MKHKSNKTEKIIKKRILTTMIGALARFENSFGYLWGIDNPNPTQDQLNNEAIWEKLRTEILDHGNNQIRGAILELKEDQDIDKVKYSYYYKVNNRRKDQ